MWDFLVVGLENNTLIQMTKKCGIYWSYIKTNFLYRFCYTAKIGIILNYAN